MTFAQRVGLGLQKADQLRVMLGVNVAGDIDVFMQLGCKPQVLSAIEGVFPSSIRPGGRGKSALTVDENVVFNTDVESAMRKDCAKTLGAQAAQENVADDAIPAVAVVEIDRAGPGGFN